MKTPIQEAIEKVQSLRKIDGVINPIGVVESILTKMLEKEKEVIIDAHIDGQFDETEGYPIEIAEDYYNETFNTKSNG